MEQEQAMIEYLRTLINEEVQREDRINDTCDAIEKQLGIERKNAHITYDAMGTPKEIIYRMR